MVAAQEAGHFNAEMAPVEVKTKKGKESMQKDEHPKPQTTLEQLAKLPAVFKKDGTVTAGNASVSTSKPWFVEVSPLAVSKFVVTVVVSFLSHLWLSAASPGEKDFCFFLIFAMFVWI